jgi:hypothetical protein
MWAVVYCSLGCYGYGEWFLAVITGYGSGFCFCYHDGRFIPYVVLRICLTVIQSSIGI